MPIWNLQGIAIPLAGLTILTHYFQDPGGGSMRIIGEVSPITGGEVASAGVNDSGFAIANTTVYEDTIREVSNFKVVPYAIPRGNVATYFPETNPLVPVNLVAKKSHTPCSKSVVVRVTAI